jgi:serine/threonine-protein kinase
VNTDAVAQLAEHLKDRYAIEREIGAGGMATVYLARDLRHDRHVALKVLNPELGAVLGVERFLSEIRVTANLQHPNLLPLFDSGEAGGLLYYVMPYVEGESLRHRLDREQQLPVDDAVHIALAVANALDYAHAHEVIHRDLKPENILLQHGEPVVADFGIALAVSRAGGSRVTQTGLSLGTPMYMSPEQATGDRVIDGRSDLYSLGAVLYEMLAGEPPHAGNSAQAIIAKLMTEEPRPITVLRPATPAPVAAAVHRALQKLPADRFRTAREFADALRAKTTGEQVWVGAGPVRRGARRWWPLAAAGVVGIVVGGAAMQGRGKAAASSTTLRFDFVVPDSQHAVPVSAIPFGFSADDRRIVYVGTAGAQERLYIHDLDDMQTRVLPGTEGSPRQPTFSPDGNSVAFILDDRLVKSPAAGGPLRTLLPLNGQGNAGLSWVDPDTIVASIGGALTAVATNGGGSVPVSRPDTAHGELSQWGPRVVSARYVAYVSLGDAGVSAPRLAVLDRRSGNVVITREPCTTVLGTVDGRLLWVTPGGSVMAARIGAGGQVERAQLVMEGVLVRPGGAAKAALSAGGSLIYHRGVAASQLVLVDEHGVETPVPGDVRAYGHPRFSPDGTRIAVVIAGGAGSDIWLLDVRTGALRQLTSDGVSDQPSWSPDGQRIVYRDRPPSGARLQSVSADGGDVRVLVDSASDPFSPIMSPNQKVLLFTAYSSQQGAVRMAEAPAAGGHEPTFIAGPTSTSFVAAFSPDGKWIAAAEGATGGLHVEIRPYPGPGAAVRVSPAQGSEPLWSADGRTLYYRWARTVYAAHLAFDPEPRVTATTTLFTSDLMFDPAYGSWDLAPDGHHFLMVHSVEQPDETVVIWHWADELRRAWARE